MSDPQSTNLGLYLPTRGSDVGTWDLPVNANGSALDGLFANVATISLTNLNVTLTTPPNSGSAWSGPYQSQSGIIKFTGTLTGNCTVTLPRAGFWIVDNQCVVGGFYVRLASAAPGNVIGVPPSQPIHVYCDGINVSYVNLGAVGSALDLQGIAALPAWISACSVLPYLIKDGTVQTYANYPALGRMLGSTFGGNGITTFGLPDERNRWRIPIDTQLNGRITVAGCGIDGATMGSTGGSQFLAAHGHTVNDPGHTHLITTLAGLTAQQGSGASYTAIATSGTGNPTTDTAFTGITVQNAGTGSSANMIPGIVSFLPLIKT